MAHFAQLDENKKVINVIVIDNSVMLDESGIESENLGIAFCKSLFGEETNWVQSSYNGNFRGKHAGINDTYDENKNIFVRPRPYNSWIFNDEKLVWECPKPYPADKTKVWEWNEDLLDWEDKTPVLPE